MVPNSIIAHFIIILLFYFIKIIFHLNPYIKLAQLNIVFVYSHLGLAYATFYVYVFILSVF